jgi:hypothetical protein
MRRAVLWIMTRLVGPFIYISGMARKRPKIIDLDEFCFQAISQRIQIE